MAAPQSGSGKTVLTLGLLRALRDQGLRVASAKIGPDYIDPQFHEAASGRTCFNLDLWAMGPDLVRSLLAQLAETAEIIVIEGVMGLFDGPERGRGSTADLAEDLGLPVVLVVDCSRQGQSIAALVEGFMRHRRGVEVAGVLLNRVAGRRHETILREALAAAAIPVLGCVRRDGRLVLPSRHLGLVQAGEHAGLDAFLRHAGQALSAGAGAVAGITVPLEGTYEQASATSGTCCDFLSARFNGLARVAVARDEAFSFCYPHLLSSWRSIGVEIAFFSPLGDEAPEDGADAVFLPGGYPELHAERLAASGRFLSGLRHAAARGAGIYGECGGFMALGEYLIDADGRRHAMAGLLPLGTSFASRRLTLGYRWLTGAGTWKGHEFHYSTIDWLGEAEPLFQARDAAGRDLGPMGMRRGRVMGSFAHVIA